MPNNYYEITLQIIFAVRNRDALITDTFRDKLHAYITGIVKKQGQKLLVINSVPDHIHILVGISPEMRISDLVREIKSESSAFINRRNLSSRRFYWQAGYGVFSYSISQRPRVINYIKNQQMHHQRKTFKKEYLEFLEAFEINFKMKYLFDFFD